MAQTNASQLFSVEGMVVAITGGATGIGLMMTTALLDNGAAKVYIIGRRKEKLEETAKQSDKIVPIVGDVNSKDSLRSVASQIKQDSGFVNLLCCNSGSHIPGMGAGSADVSVADYAAKALEQSMENWSTTFTTNCVSVPFTTMAFLELLDAGNKRGNCAGRKSQVLVTTSIAGYLRTAGAFGAYNASKAATTHLIKQMSGALVAYDIRVNGIAPGLFPSDLAAGIIDKVRENDMDAGEEGALARTTIPAQRIGRSEDMAGTILYIASAAGAYLNGNITVLDGGRIAVLNGTY